MPAVLEAPSVVTASSISPTCLEIVGIGSNYLTFRNVPWGTVWKKVFSTPDKRRGDQVVVGKKHGDGGERLVHVSALVQTLNKSGGLSGKEFSTRLLSILH